ncbi:TonB-dependent receptor plug domain-containing protein [Sulfurimonas sp.]
MKKLLLLFISIWLIASENDTLNLLDDLNNASKIATRTKLNIDETPAVVSVLHAKELKKLGIINLYEALETVPGIEISMGTGGAKQINMRGNKSLIRDKLKLMINGISVNSELSGSSFFYQDMPIELIERIEVIRGPSSALYGSFAHIGAINVITKSSTNQGTLIFANTSSENFNDTGFVHQIKSDSISINLDGFFQKNNNNRSYGPYSSISSPTSFTSYEDFTNKSLGTNINFNDELSFQARWLKLNTQNFYGYGDWPINNDPKRLKTTSIISELQYTPKLSKNSSMDIKAGYKQYEFEGDARYNPYPLYTTIPNDLIAKGYYREEIFYSDIALNYTLDNHEFLVGTYLSDSKEAETDYAINNPLVSEELNIPLANIKKNISRYQYAFYLHDIYTISDEFTLNIGGRYDHYSDTDSSFAPKVALLYKNSDTDSYKLMYQRSFRAPSWLELYGYTNPYIGNTFLNSETIDTVEFAYSHKNSLDNRFTLNLFYSRMKDFINRDSNFNLFNDNQIRSIGAELEWQIPINESTKLKSNYSLIRIKDNNKNNLPFVANHLANIMLFKQWHRNWSSGSTLRYVSKRRRETADTRADLEGYTRFDQAITYTYKSFSFQATVKNIFDESIKFPSKLGSSSTMGTYTSDFTRDGRTFWFSIEWRL